MTYIQSTEYKSGDFTDVENSSVVKILLDFISMLDKSSKTVFTKVEVSERKQNCCFCCFLLVFFWGGDEGHKVKCQGFCFFYYSEKKTTVSAIKISFISTWNSGISHLASIGLDIMFFHNHWLFLDCSFCHFYVHFYFIYCNARYFFLKGLHISFLTWQDWKLFLSI
jgi:hypothetical protein